jgi:hypothetical protein
MQYDEQWVDRFSEKLCQIKRKKYTVRQIVPARNN